MRNNKLRASLAAALMLGSTAVLVSAGDVANAVGPTTPAGSLTLSPASGVSGTAFTLSSAGALNCTSSFGADGETYNAVIAPTATNFSTYVWPGEGGSHTGGVQSLEAVTSWGSIAADSPTMGGLVGGDPYTVPPASQTRFSADVPGSPATPYSLVIACVRNNETTKYWTAPITVTDNAPGAGNTFGFSWASGVVPAAPAITNVTSGDGTASVTFTHAASTPATEYFVVRAHPQGVSGSASDVVVTPNPTTPGTVAIPGLTNGTVYDITVVAHNSTGDSPASNVGTASPGLAAQPPVASISAVPGSSTVQLSWTAPVGATQPITGYLVTADNGATPASITVGNSVFTQAFTGVSTTSPTTFSVTPQFAGGYVAPAATTQATALAAEVITQTITVTRPAGALILTQRCGVYGELPAEPADTAFPGYPLPVALAAADAGTPAGGTSPDIDTATPGLQVDPQFPNYPFPSPVTYPTNCGLSLGTASLVTTGALAGQYYAASGRLNQVTVVDTRDQDNGWNVAGQMSSFVGNTPTNTFSGNYLGWTPKVTSDSAPNLGYDQDVTAGAPVAPGSGVSTGTGLAGGGKSLGSAAAGDGVGVAVLDARIKLLIPVTANADTYTGILTLSSI